MEQLPAAVDDKTYELIESFLGQHVAQQFLYEPKGEKWQSLFKRSLIL